MDNIFLANRSSFRVTLNIDISEVTTVIDHDIDGLQIHKFDFIFNPSSDKVML